MESNDEESILDKGSFKNYVDQFLSYFDHLPTYRGLLWTFGALSTLFVHMDIEWNNPIPPYFPTLAIKMFAMADSFNETLQKKSKLSIALL